jgi:hypothetical protein
MRVAAEELEARYADALLEDGEGDGVARLSAGVVGHRANGTGARG